MSRSDSWNKMPNLRLLWFETIEMTYCIRQIKSSHEHNILRQIEVHFCSILMHQKSIGQKFEAFAESHSQYSSLKAIFTTCFKVKRRYIYPQQWPANMLCQLFSRFPGTPRLVSAGTSWAGKIKGTDNVNATECCHAILLASRTCNVAVKLPFITKRALTLALFYRLISKQSCIM